VIQQTLLGCAVVFALGFAAQCARIWRQRARVAMS